MEKDINHLVGREQELFPIIRRFCTEQTCYQDLKPDDQVSRYYKNTTQLLVEDLLKETPDPDDTYTIATNYMLIMANTAEAQKKKKKMISFVKEAYDAENAKTMVANTFNIPTGHEQTTAPSNKNEKSRKLLIFLIVIGFLFLAGSLLFGIKSASEMKNLENIKPESKNVFQKFGDWVSHDVFHSPRKETESERQRTAITSSANLNRQVAQYLRIAAVCMFIASCILAVKSKFWKSKGNLSEWEDYQKLCSLFDEAETRVLGGIG